MGDFFYNWFKLLIFFLVIDICWHNKYQAGRNLSGESFSNALAGIRKFLRNGDLEGIFFLAISQVIKSMSRLLLFFFEGNESVVIATI